MVSMPASLTALPTAMTRSSSAPCLRSGQQSTTPPTTAGRNVALPQVNPFCAIYVPVPEATLSDLKVSVGANSACPQGPSALINAFPAGGENWYDEGRALRPGLDSER